MMGVEELFKKAENIFGIKINEQNKKENKREELLLSMDEKITSIVDKIREEDDDEKKQEMKKELTILQDLKKECEELS